MGLIRNIKRIRKVIEKGTEISELLADEDDDDDDEKHKPSRNESIEKQLLKKVVSSSISSGSLKSGIQRTILESAPSKDEGETIGIEGGITRATRYCSFCGQKLRNGASFCSACGEKIQMHATEDLATGDKTSKATCIVSSDKNSIGEEVPSADVMVQPAEKTKKTRYPRKKAKTPAELEEYYSRAKSDESRIRLVANFSIPEEEEEILQLIELCENHIITDKKRIKKEESYEVETAWMEKLEQIYERVSIFMKGTPLHERVEASYYEGKEAFQKKNTFMKQLSRACQKNSALIALVALLVLCLLVIALSVKSLDKKEEAKKKNYTEAVKTVKSLMESDDLDSALKKAESISASSDEEKKERQQLINEIIRRQGNDEGKIVVPYISNELQYSVVVTRLEYAGFTDVSAEPLKADAIEKIKQTVGNIIYEKIESGGVLELSVNGKTQYFDGFSHEKNRNIVGTYVPFDAKIVIRYKE